MTESSSVHSRRGFSLIELLVVCGIIAIIAAFAIPASVTMIRGSQLTQGSQILIDQISLARQSAVTRNRSVEVRFYQYKDPESPGETTGDGKFRGLQLFEIIENGAAVPLGKFQRLPSAIVINRGQQLSSLLKPEARKAERKSGDVELPILAGGGDKRWDYKIVSFRFLPSGATDLVPTENWFVTIHGQEAADTVTQPPANFFTVQIDPVNGSTRSYRPTAG